MQAMRMVRHDAPMALPMFTMVNMLYLDNKTFGKRKNQNARFMKSTLKKKKNAIVKLTFSYSFMLFHWHGRIINFPMISHLRNMKFANKFYW